MNTASWENDRVVAYLCGLTDVPPGVGIEGYPFLLEFSDVVVLVISEAQ